jgi:soluble lytic murein transglycosylase-like protein
MVRTLVAILALAGSAFAGEYAVLGSGFRIHVDHHQADGNVVRLYSGGGVTELGAEAIAGFEADEIVPEKAPEPTALAAPAAVAPNPRVLVEAAARKHGLPPAFLHSVVAAESGYRADAVSPKGAIGLMQVMPATARAYGADPSIPEQNVDAGAQYLRDLLLKYQGDDHQVSRALAAYNAGPGAVERFDGVPPYQETQDYVARVIRDYAKRQTISPKMPDRSSLPE